MSEAKIVLTAVDQTKAALESAKRNIASIGDTVTRATSLMGPMAAGVLSVAGAVTMLSKALDTMDQLDEMSEKTGVSVEALSKLRFAGESVGTTTEQLGGGMRKLAKLMGEAAGGSDEAAEIFKTMGVSFKDASGNLRSTDKVLEDIAERFSGYADGPAKAALAMKVFGKSGEDMIPMLNLGKDGLASMATEAERLGINLGGDAAKAAADFNDNMKKLSLTSEAAGMSIVGQLLPSLIQITQELLAGIKNADGFMDAIFVMGTINPFKTQAENIRSLTDELKDLEKRKSSFGGDIFATEAVKRGVDSDIALAKKKLGYLRDLQQSRALASAGDTGDAVSRRFMRPQTKSAAPIVEKKDAKAQSDFGANLVNSLTTQYANLSGQMSKVDEVQRMLLTSGDKFTFAQKEQALAVAAQIDAYRDKKVVDDYELKNSKDLIDRKKDAEKVYGATILALSEEARAMEFNTSLIGKSAEEVERLTFERELAIRVAQADALITSHVNAGLITQIEATERLSDVQRKASDTRAQFMAQQADQISQQYDAMRGVSDAVKEYQLSISKMGENTKNVMTNAFRGMEDALVNFVKTGKLDFKSLADSIISDMIRMQIQQSVTGPLSGILGKAIGSVFSAGFSGGGAINPNSGEYMGSLEFANGGIMTSGGELPLHAYSSGGIASTPQLAVFGEGRMNEAYVPLPDGRTIPVTMSGGGSSVIVNVMPTSGQTADVQQRENGDGTTTIDVILRQVQDGLADGVASGSGSLFNAIGSRFTPRGAQ